MASGPDDRTDAKDDTAPSRGWTSKEIVANFGILTVLAPVVIGCIRVVAVSQGDILVMSTIVANLDIKTIVLAAVVPMIPVLGFTAVLIVGLFLWRLDPRKPKRILMLLPIALALIAYTYIYALLAAIFCFFIGFVIVKPWKLRSSRQALHPDIKRQLLRSAGILYCMLILLYMFLSQNWLPVEAIATKDETPRPAYVLKDDGKYVLVLYTRTREIERVLADSLTLREICWAKGNNNVFTTPLLAYIMASPPTRDCPF